MTETEALHASDVLNRRCDSHSCELGADLQCSGQIIGERQNHRHNLLRGECNHSPGALAGLDLLHHAIRRDINH